MPFELKSIMAENGQFVMKIWTHLVWEFFWGFFLLLSFHQIAFPLILSNTYSKTDPSYNNLFNMQQ